MEFLGPPDPRDLGHTGEQAAVDFFLERGHTLLARNFRTRYGELDAVFGKNDEVIFVEVKMRGESPWVTPEEAVTKGKQKRIIKAALQFIKQRDLRRHQFRFDVVIVQAEGVQHIPNAFASSRWYTF